MKLSIITINYNNLNGLQKTIDSVVNQTWHDFEWIIIDGGSTDGSKELIEKYQEHFTYWCSEPDNGIYNAMNKGIAKAQGDYLNFMNSGDGFYSPNTLEQVFSIGRSDDILYGDMICKYQDGSYHSWSYPHKLSLHYLIVGYLGHAASFIKSPLLKDNGYCEDYKIVSDWQKFLEWFKQGKSFFHTGIVIASFDTPGTSADTVLCNQERQKVCDDLFGIQNRSLIEESIQIQHLLDRMNHDTILNAIDNIRKHGGKRVALLYRFINVLNKTIKNS